MRRDKRKGHELRPLRQRLTPARRAARYLKAARRRLARAKWSAEEGVEMPTFEAVPVGETGFAVRVK